MAVFSHKRKEILSENVRIQEGCCPNRISKSKQRGSEAKIGARIAAVATQNRLSRCIGPESPFSDRGLDSAFLIGRIGAGHSAPFSMTMRFIAPEGLPHLMACLTDQSTCHAAAPRYRC